MLPYINFMWLKMQHKELENATRHRIFYGTKLASPQHHFSERLTRQQALGG
jgi:hypothetical protein